MLGFPRAIDLCKHIYQTSDRGTDTRICFGDNDIQYQRSRDSVFLLFVIKTFGIMPYHTCCLLPA